MAYHYGLVESEDFLIPYNSIGRMAVSIKMDTSGLEHMLPIKRRGKN